MSKIHSTAIISDGAQIGSGVEIGPYAIIGPEVVLGADCKIFGHAMISGRTRLGAACEVYPFAHIGGKTQDLKYDGGKTFVEIGARTVLREYVTVHCGTKDGETTTIGEDCLFMAYTHVAHGCVVGNHVIVSNGTQIAGEVQVGDYVTMSGLCGIHQFCRIGSHCMVGVGTIALQDIPPYMIVSDSPPAIRGVNLIGLSRRGFPEGVRDALRSAYKLLCRSGLNVSDALAEIEATLPPLPEIVHLVEFFRTTKRGVIK